MAITKAGQIYLDADGKPVLGVFTIAEIEKAFGPLAELAPLIEASGGFIKLIIDIDPRHVPPIANVEQGPI